MGAHPGLHDGWFWEDDAVLDAIEVLQGQADGTFYPTEYGPESLVDVACPDLWGYLVPRAEAEPFERLFAAREDEQIAELYGGRFAYARWDIGADGEAKASFLPAPPSAKAPVTASTEKARGWFTTVSTGATSSEPAMPSCFGEREAALPRRATIRFSLFRSIRRSARGATRRLWGFAI